MTVLEAARSAYAAGLCLLPTRKDGSKAPDVARWTAFQRIRPTVEQMRAFDLATQVGFGVIAGAVSAYRECWDFDCAETYARFLERAVESGLDDVVDRITRGYCATTPNDGRRWIVTYPVSITWRDCTLARRPRQDDDEPAVKTLIELPTFAIVAPSHGSTHPSGRPYVQVAGSFETIASYTVDEREALFALARSFDRMPRSVVPRAPTRAADGDRPGDHYNTRTTWPALLESHGWTHAYDRGEVSYWRRPDKALGISASSNFCGSDLLFVFTTSTAFESDKSYSKFAAYAILEHGGDYRKAARQLAELGYGGPEKPPVMKATIPPTTPTARTLTETLAVFQRWLSLDDPSSVYAVAATLVANRAIGDPVWLLLVAAPSTGKTEILSAATRLPWVISAAKVTEASLLSGTSFRERAAAATGGLLRQVGAFGVLLCKDFTSVLAQNKDARAEAMAALREVYDGSWDRPVGTDGGRVLQWRGKCGLLGGVTPALDQYGQVLSALGDRFLLLRMPDADVDSFGRAALGHGDQEQQMRDDLREALAGLVEHVDVTAVNRVLQDDERTRLIRLAAYTARARTAVMRDGYRQDVVYLPQVEGPGRLVKAYARLLGGLESIGCDPATAWAILQRIAVDSAPALRTKLIRELVGRPVSVRTSDIASAIETVTKTASRHLEDLAILKLVLRHKRSTADNSPDYWEASPWLRDYWPLSETEKYPATSDEPEQTRDVGGQRGGGTTEHPSGISQSQIVAAFDVDDLPAALHDSVEKETDDRGGKRGAGEAFDL